MAMYCNEQDWGNARPTDALPSRQVADESSAPVSLVDVVKSIRRDEHVSAANCWSSVPPNPRSGAGETRRTLCFHLYEVHFVSVPPVLLC